jgi:hypothetical protein
MGSWKIQMPTLGFLPINMFQASVSFTLSGESEPFASKLEKCKLHPQQKLGARGTSQSFSVGVVVLWLCSFPCCNLQNHLDKGRKKI